MSLRLEKGWGAWGLDYRADYTAAESGMDSFIDWGSDFIGKDATLREAKRGPEKKLVTMVVETIEDIDVCHRPPLWSHSGIGIKAPPPDRHNGASR